MDTSSNSFKVGVLVVVCLAVLIEAFNFFYGLETSKHYYRYDAQFDAAQGVISGSEVDLAGVKVGLVDKLVLSSDYKAIVHMQIERRYRIPKKSVVTISSGLLGGNTNIVITPPPPDQIAKGGYMRPGGTLIGTQPLDFSTLGAQAGSLVHQANALFGDMKTTSEKANKLLDSLTQTAQSVNSLVGDKKLKEDVGQTVQNLADASMQGVQLTHQLQQALVSDNAGAQKTFINLNSATGTINDLVKQDTPRLNAIVENLNQTTSSLREMTVETRRKFDRSGVAQNLADTVDNLKRATSELDEIASDVHNLTGDKNVQADLKTTMHNVAQTTAQAQQVVAKLGSIVSPHAQLAGSGMYRFEGRLDFTQNFPAKEFRTDFDLLAPLSSTDFMRLGVYDLTGGNKLNAQYGRRAIALNVDARAGVYDGKVGVGADTNLFGANSLSFDLYDPNRLRLDANSRITIAPQTALILGLEDIPRTNEIAAGIELSR